MQTAINFRQIFLELKHRFDRPTTPYRDFDAWRQHTYEEVRTGTRPNLPLKTWWPHYSTGDFRLELCLGVLLVQQVSWPQVRTCLENLRDVLARQGAAFDVPGLLSIAPDQGAQLIQASRFPHRKWHNIVTLCAFLQDTGTVESLFRQVAPGDLGWQLQRLKAGFGPESRDCVLLYAANAPVFIVDTYARQLLRTLNVTAHADDYGACQRLWEEGIRRDFTAQHLEGLVQEYTPEELRYALCNTPQPEVAPWVLLYQQLHAGIVELGISGRGL